MIRKAVGIYRNQGAKVLIKKASKYFKYKSNFLYGNVFVKKNHNLTQEYNFVSNPIFQITESDIKSSHNATSRQLPKKIKTANWFVPNFDHIKFGGVFTIFRFIEKLSIEGVENRIIIYDNPSFNSEKLREEIGENFSKLVKYKVIIFDMNNDGIDAIPSSDISFCSFWTSAYVLLKFNRTKRKYYFIQDYEPLFYPGGSTYALAESTYRFGFRGLVNTPGLLAAVNSRHGMEGISFIPAVDQSLYYPINKLNDKIRVFFYARPNNPRNAFNLGIVIIKKLLENYADRIEIVTAGANWNEKDYDLSGKITNYGLLKNLNEVADLYRNCDIGFVYMLSKHPSYQPFEFMASGVATVTNNNEDNLWLLKDGYNCLISEPSPAAMAEKIGLLIENEKLRNKIIKNGLNSLGYTWGQQTDMVWNDIRNH
ncbi:glycosyltransferase family 4 protein [Candidatus Roizmanbacteria bacterium]|nr:glycosyltransferase family 4 protein [Candidatus Roizmanbacteria bacterium]